MIENFPRHRTAIRENFISHSRIRLVYRYNWADIRVAVMIDICTAIPTPKLAVANMKGTATMPPPMIADNIWKKV